jgi:hypothetical protein
MGADLAERVRAYLAGGGKVIASHHSGMTIDREEFVLPELGVVHLAPARYSPDFVVPGAEISEGILAAEHVMYDRGLEVEAIPGTQILAKVWHPYFNRTWEHFCSHRHTPVEKESPFPAIVATENTAYFVHPIFAALTRHGVTTYKRVFLNVLRRFLAEPLIRTNAPSTAHITLQRQESKGRTIAHVLHYIPEQRYKDIQIVEDVIPLHNVKLAVRLDQEPRRVYLAPDGTDLPATWAAGRSSVVIPEIRGHSMVVFE